MSIQSNKKRITDFFIMEYNNLVRYVRMLIDDSAERDSEDIVQDVMLHIFDKADIIAPLNNLSAYIYSSLKNKVIDIFRKKKSEVISLDAQLDKNCQLTLSDIIHDSRYDVASEHEKKEKKKQLYKTFETLDDKDRAIIIATEIEQRSFKELSHEWGIPIGTLLARKSRGLKKIKALLMEDLT